MNIGQLVMSKVTHNDYRVKEIHGSELRAVSLEKGVTINLEKDKVKEIKNDSLSFSKR